MSERSFREPRHRGFDNGFVQGRPHRSSRPAFGAAPRRQSTLGPPIRATLKWFSPEKGFGFVALDDGAGDAFLHATIVEQSGCEAAKLQPGAVLQVTIGQGQKGLQVSEILTVKDNTAEPSDMETSGMPARRERPGFRQAMPGRSNRITGTVKWYSGERGFGFIAVDGGLKEVFVHATALQRSRITNLSEGQRVTFEVGQGRKGPEAVSISIAG